MFTDSELNEIVADARSGLPQSVASGPEQALSPEQRQRLRTLLLGVLKGVFSVFTGIPLPAKQAPAELEAMAPEIEAYVNQGLARRHAARVPGLPGAESVLSFPGSAEIITALVRSGLNSLVETYGDAVVDMVLTQKETILKYVGDPVLEKADRLIHGLLDLQGSS